MNPIPDFKFQTPVVVALLVAGGVFENPATLEVRGSAFVLRGDSGFSAVGSWRACAKKSFASRSPMFSMKYVFPVNQSKMIES